MRHRQLERVAQARQVAQEQLVLQRLGGGADQRARAATAAAAPGRRRSCRRRCRPRRRARRARRWRRATRQRHRAACALGVARIVAASAPPCEQAPRALALRAARRRGDRFGAARGASGGGRSRRLAAGRARLRGARSGRAAAGAASSGAAASGRRAARRADARSIRLSRSACSMRSSIRRRCGECRLSSMGWLRTRDEFAGFAAFRGRMQTRL